MAAVTTAPSAAIMIRPSMSNSCLKTSSSLLSLIGSRIVESEQSHLESLEGTNTCASLLAVC